MLFNKRPVEITRILVFCFSFGINLQSRVQSTFPRKLIQKQRLLLMFLRDVKSLWVTSIDMCHLTIVNIPKIVADIALNWTN